MNLDTSSGEKRHDTRYNASWRAALVIGDQLTYEGRLKDISASGAAILIESNVNVGVSVELHMLLPVTHQGYEQKVIIVHGKTCNSTFDSKHYCFRVGINFDRFLVPTDREFLTIRLETHHRVVAESRYGP
jgi:c-di-GMP-binding flagellar brake protein YcgR